MSLVTVRVGGHSLRDFGPYSPVTMSTTTRGAGVLSWRMDPDRHRSLHTLVGALVYGQVGGSTVWAGHLDEPGTDGEYHAVGLSVLADTAPALDGSGDPTADGQTAVNAARARGDLDGWAASGVTGAWSGDPGTGMTVAGLLDAITTDAGWRWLVDERGHLRFYSALPGAPDWHYRTRSYRYGWSAEGLVTHLTGYYMSGVGTYAEVTIATGVPGLRRAERLDITDRGILTSGAAQAVLAGIVARQGKATPSATARVEIGPGELTTPGGTPVPGLLIRGQHTLRIWGASDGRSGADYLDVRVGETEYDDDTGTVVVTPANLAPRGYLAAMAEALST